MSNSDYEIPENCNFNTVDNTSSSNECSPKINTPTFEGLIINVPKIINFKDDMEAILACTYSFSNKTDLGNLKEVRNSIVFTVIDTKTHVPFSGVVQGLHNPILPPNLQATVNQMKKTSDEIPTQYQEGYVNINLFDVVSMPKETGKYIVYATVSNYKSNVVEFEIVESAQD